MATLGAVLWLVATLGPSFLALLGLILLWLSFGRPLWRRLIAVGTRNDHKSHDPV